MCIRLWQSFWGQKVAQFWPQNFAAHLLKIWYFLAPLPIMFIPTSTLTIFRALGVHYQDEQQQQPLLLRKLSGRIFSKIIKFQIDKRCARSLHKKSLGNQMHIDVHCGTFQWFSTTWTWNNEFWKHCASLIDFKKMAFYLLLMLCKERPLIMLNLEWMMMHNNCKTGWIFKCFDSCLDFNQTSLMNIKSSSTLLLLLTAVIKRF